MFHFLRTTCGACPGLHLVPHCSTVSHLESLKHERDALQVQLQNQKFTPADVERINREKRELQQTITSLNKSLEDAEQHKWNEEIALAKVKEKVCLKHLMVGCSLPLTPHLSVLSLCTEPRRSWGCLSTTSWPVNWSWSRCLQKTPAAMTSRSGRLNVDPTTPCSIKPRYRWVLRTVAWKCEANMFCANSEPPRFTDAPEKTDQRRGRGERSTGQHETQSGGVLWTSNAVSFWSFLSKFYWWLEV